MREADEQWTWDEVKNKSKKHVCSEEKNRNYPFFPGLRRGERAAAEGVVPGGGAGGEEGGGEGEAVHRLQQIRSIMKIKKTIAPEC